MEACACGFRQLGEIRLVGRVMMSECDRRKKAESRPFFERGCCGKSRRRDAMLKHLVVGLFAVDRTRLEGRSDGFRLWVYLGQ